MNSSIVKVADSGKELNKRVEILGKLKLRMNSQKN